MAPKKLLGAAIPLPITRVLRIAAREARKMCLTFQEAVREVFAFMGLSFLCRRWARRATNFAGFHRRGGASLLPGANQRRSRVRNRFGARSGSPLMSV